MFLSKGAKEEDIATYNINPQSKNTVIIWRASSVKRNFVDVDSKKLSEIKQAVAEMLK